VVLILELPAFPSMISGEWRNSLRETALTIFKVIYLVFFPTFPNVGIKFKCWTNVSCEWFSNNGRTTWWYYTICHFVSQYKCLLVQLSYSGFQPMDCISCILSILTAIKCLMFNRYYGKCVNLSLYVKIMPANIASPSMHLNTNIWLPYQRTVATLSKKVNVCIFTSAVGWLTLFSRFSILAIWWSDHDSCSICIVIAIIDSLLPITTHKYRIDGFVVFTMVGYLHGCSIFDVSVQRHFYNRRYSNEGIPLRRSGSSRWLSG